MVIKYTAEQWAAYSEGCHRSAFGKEKPASWDRISYALVTVDEKTETPHGYVTVRENDPESVYWQFGGAFLKFQRSVHSVRGYADLLEYQSRLAKRVSTYIQNTNLPMLKLAMAYGFLIIGTRTVREDIYVDLLKEF